MTYTYSRQQECDEWHIPYHVTQEECDEADNRAQYDYEVMRQAEIDDQARES